MNLELLAAIPGFPRAKATINSIQPGETILRTFPLPGARAQLTQPLRGAVSVTESGATESFRLIKPVTLE